MNDWEKSLNILLSKLVDDELTGVEQSLLNDLLANHPEAIELYHQYLEIHSSLHEHLGVPEFSALDATLMPSGEAQQESKLPRPFFDWRSGFAAAAAIVVLASLLIFRTDADPQIARITEIHGPVQWIDHRGVVDDALEIDRALGAGTLESMSEGSWVRFVFSDETAVTLSGRSLAAISDLSQKELRVRYGNLSANVTPQPDQKPMLIHTPTADLEVLGTQFNLESGPSSTLLAVNKGRVLMKKLSDGEEVEVPAGRQAIASIDAQEDLVVTSRKPIKNAWRSDLKEDISYGTWVPDLTALALRLKKAVASGDMTKKAAMVEYKAAADPGDNKGSVWAKPWLVNYSKEGKNQKALHLATFSVTRRQTSPIVLVEGAKLRIQGGILTPAEIVFGISVHHSSGGFEGKYQLTRKFEKATESDWREFNFVAPVTDFQKKETKNTELTNKELVELWCLTEGKNAKLEIRNVELLAP